MCAYECVGHASVEFIMSDSPNAHPDKQPKNNELKPLQWKNKQRNRKILTEETSDCSGRMEEDQSLVTRLKCCLYMAGGLWSAREGWEVVAMVVAEGKGHVLFC